ncbi:uncharacterized protein LOC329839 [Mus musculus]|uniref:Uncharacterized protein n=1 Tax=Mus musculus TaxID=10090 RepID=Q3UGT0_MOUSE|nr:uncharacterized protein LOC329839 [Mus musculus]BAE28127.1 unnamed protein product [Mus musculus]|eukprot:NP_001028584.1 uncharacterized protein LOC329839 [Mus musculus]
MTLEDNLQCEKHGLLSDEELGEPMRHASQTLPYPALPYVLSRAFRTPRGGRFKWRAKLRPWSRDVWRSTVATGGGCTTCFKTTMPVSRCPSSLPDHQHRGLGGLSTP